MPSIHFTLHLHFTLLDIPKKPCPHKRFAELPDEHLIQEEKGTRIVKLKSEGTSLCLKCTDQSLEAMSQMLHLFIRCVTIYFSFMLVQVPFV